ncbi:MAG TPA: methyltransferase domain-containing protein [Opitutaceae bacterium]|nr:methyltransferase domain-containing protein [Opitutaceae bacterium]
MSNLSSEQQSGKKEPSCVADVSALGPNLEPKYWIQDFSCFRDILFCRGIVEHQESEVLKIWLLRPDKVWEKMDYSLDGFQNSDAKRTCFHFNWKLPAEFKGSQFEQMDLALQFGNAHMRVPKPMSQGIELDRFHRSEGKFWAAVNANPMARVLEIGSRARSGITRRHLFPSTCDYAGFDIIAGPNVDVVGDAHELSQYFPANHFDFAWSVSVWEHLCMPWKVSLELNKVLKLGGVAMINTHQSWPSHEEPWDYFRFSEYSWSSLFNAATGFEIIDSGQGSSCVMVPSLYREELYDQKIEWHYGFLASRCVARKISETKLEWPVDSKTVSRNIYPN